jgi:S-adenosylmethionine synthetase
VVYAIGVARAVSVLIETFGTERVDRKVIETLVPEHFDLRPAAFHNYLRLHRPVYSPTAAYGHFGRPDRGGTAGEDGMTAALIDGKSVAARIRREVARDHQRS